jgi:transposase
MMFACNKKLTVRAHPSQQGEEIFMTMKIEFTPETIKELKYWRYHHPVPLVQRRMDVLLLKNYNMSHARIAEINGISENTVRDYFQLYEQGGIEKLKEININHREGALAIHITSLETYFKEHPPATIKEAQQKIKEITGIVRGETQIRQFFKKNSICIGAGSG